MHKRARLITALLTRVTRVSAILAVASASTSAPLIAASDARSEVEVRGGTVHFEAPTTVPSIKVHGKSTELDARASVRDIDDSLSLESIEATLPVKSLATGMFVRDEHMRKLVFTNADGSTPDVTFVSNGASCTSDRVKRQTECTVSGELTIRGVARPFTMTLAINRSGTMFRASGDGFLKLSAYGIEQPAQFGVRVSDTVKLHFDFVARPAVETIARSGSSR
jgi:polyisoprenoid-binding protein YceI